MVHNIGVTRWRFSSAGIQLSGEIYPLFLKINIVLYPLPNKHTLDYTAFQGLSGLSNIPLHTHTMFLNDI